MANYVVTASGTSQATGPIQTDKVRIGTTVAIQYTVGNSSVTTSTSTGIVIGANQIERDIYVGAGNYIAIIAVATGGACSITELGAIPNRNLVNGYYTGPQINPGASVPQ